MSLIVRLPEVTLNQRSRANMLAAMKARRFDIVAKTLVTILSLAAVCYCQDSRVAQAHPNSLIVLSSSSHVWYTAVAGKTQLMYNLNLDYPAKSALRTISTKLQREGWTPLKSDFLNPPIPSSHLSGWEQFDDDTTKPRTTVRQWIGQWENKRREIVWYSLEYRYPTSGTSDLHNLRILAQFIPADVAAKMKEETATTETKK
jgi:hypothetical protein